MGGGGAIALLSWQQQEQHSLFSALVYATDIAASWTDIAASCTDIAAS